MYRWREKEKIIALKLRGLGKSYREVQSKIPGISRSTLSIWFRDLKLSPAAAKILEAKKERAENNIIKWSKERSAAAKTRNTETTQEYSDAIGKLSRRDLMLVGASLYWGEGSLQIRGGPYPHHKTEFSNSSPEMTRVFMRFAREILGVPTEQFRPHVQIYPNLDAQESIAFWAKVTEIPDSYFRAYTQVSSASKHKRPINFLPHGTVQIRINNPVNFYKIQGCINGIIKNANS